MRSQQRTDRSTVFELPFCPPYTELRNAHVCDLPWLTGLLDDRLAHGQVLRSCATRRSRALRAPRRCVVRLASRSRLVHADSKAGRLEAIPLHRSRETSSSGRRTRAAKEVRPRFLRQNLFGTGEGALRLEKRSAAAGWRMARWVKRRDSRGVSFAVVAVALRNSPCLCKSGRQSRFRS